jgi:hypothetical protein
MPRDPSSLGTDGTCTWLPQFHHFLSRASNKGCRSSSAPHALPAGPWPDPMRIHDPRVLSDGNSGTWNYDRWGHSGEPGMGSGAELRAWMADREKHMYRSPLSSLTSLPRRATASTHAGKPYKTRSRGYSAFSSATWPPSPPVTSHLSLRHTHTPCVTRRSPRSACVLRTSRRPLNSCPVSRAGIAALL